MLIKDDAFPSSIPARIRPIAHFFTEWSLHSLAFYGREGSINCELQGTPWKRSVELSLISHFPRVTPWL